MRSSSELRLMSCHSLLVLAAPNIQIYKNRLFSPHRAAVSRLSAGSSRPAAGMDENTAHAGSVVHQSSQCTAVEQIFLSGIIE